MLTHNEHTTLSSLIEQVKQLREYKITFEQLDAFVKEYIEVNDKEDCIIFCNKRHLDGFKKLFASLVINRNSGCSAAEMSFLRGGVTFNLVKNSTISGIKII